MRTLLGAPTHEAGHAVVAMRVGIEVKRIVIHPDGSGCTTLLFPGDNVEMAGRNCIVSVAGPLADRGYGRDHHGDPWEIVSTCAEYPLILSRACTICMTWPELGGLDPVAIIRQCVKAAGKLLLEPDVWEDIERLADALREHGGLSGEQIEEIVP